MKGVVLWVLGASVAFLLTAGAFLVLANLGSQSAASDSIPQAEDSSEQDSAPALVLKLREDQLEKLEREPGQRLDLEIANEGDEEFPSVDLALDLYSENTVQPLTRSYKKTVDQLAPGEVRSVKFKLDLSPLTESKTRQADSGASPKVREVLEIQAATPEGVSAVKTAVLAS